jgi:hypothetical protein
MKHALVVSTLLALALTAPVEAAATGRATGIMLTYKQPDGKVRPALFSMPGYDMPMTECRQVIRGQTRIFRAQMRNDEDFVGLRYVSSACVYLDTDPLNLED